MIITTNMYSIDQDEIMRFIKADVRWPLIISPGRGKGKTNTALEIAMRCYWGTGLPALFVAPNRHEWRRLKEKCSEFNKQEKLIKFTTMANLRNTLIGVRYSIVIFDEPWGSQGFSAPVAANISKDKDVPVIIFGE